MIVLLCITRQMSECMFTVFCVIFCIYKLFRNIIEIYYLSVKNHKRFKIWTVCDFFGFYAKAYRKHVGKGRIYSNNII